MAIKTFRVLTAPHFEKNDDGKERARHHPDRYIKLTRGMTFQSEEDLMERFPGKFEEVVAATPHEVTPERMAAVTGLIASGDWTEDDRDFLQNLDADGFARMVRRSMPKEPEKKEVEKKPSAQPLLGDDVTETEFPQLVEHKLKVFRNATGMYQITKASNTKKPLNHEALDAAAVLVFVKDLVEE